MCWCLGESVLEGMCLYELRGVSLCLQIEQHYAPLTSAARRLSSGVYALVHVCVCVYVPM